MVIERNKKCPFIVYFILYLLKYQLIWILIAILVSYIIYCFKGGEWSLIAYYFSWYKDMKWFCIVGFLPLFAPYVYFYQCFCMIERLQIDEKKKTLLVDYKTFFFWNKNKVYVLDSPDFYCSISYTNYKWFINLFIPHCNTVVEFNGSTDKVNMPLLLRDRCGWEQEQLNEIYKLLKNYSFQHHGV